MVNKVNFIVIGAARSATTSICNIIADHPEVCFSEPKEPQFFSDKDWRHKLNTYHKLYKTNKAKLYGEGSTNYSKYPSYNKNIHSDIYEYNPNMKIIYIMRNPIDRIISHYQFALERGYTSDKIDKEVLSKEIYINTSSYYGQIKPYIDTFGFKNVHLIFFNDYKTNPKSTLDALFNFLEIDVLNPNKKSLHTNKSGKGSINHKKFDNPNSISDYIKKILHSLVRKLRLKKTPKPSINKATRLKILNLLENDISKLEDLTQRDLSAWRK